MKDTILIILLIAAMWTSGYFSHSAESLSFYNQKQQVSIVSYVDKDMGVHVDTTDLEGFKRLSVDNTIIKHRDVDGVLDGRKNFVYSVLISAFSYLFGIIMIIVLMHEKKQK